MVVVKKDSGKRFVPAGHSRMEATQLFGPQNGSAGATVHLSTLQRGGGMSEEVHEHSDQVFYVLAGAVQAYSAGRHQGALGPGDGVHVPAGESHGFRNDGSEPCVLYVLTVPPITPAD